MRRLLVVLSLGTLIATGFVRGGDGKKDSAALQGTWKGDFDDKKVTVQFKGNKFTVTIDDEKFKGTFMIDPSKKPKQIDMTVKEGDKFANQTSLGIYEVKGDKLKWAASEPGKEQRPEEFAAKEGSLYVVLERQKKKSK